MLYCKIADLIVSIPEAGEMARRCKEYLVSDIKNVDITIVEEKYRTHIWPRLDWNGVSYMESGIQFYTELLKYDGMMLHSSAVVYNEKAYLFSGPCGIGKSTHTRLWQQTFGSAAQVFNDDKPALRFLNGKWHAYGTPWCGKDGINQNMKVPLAGICFLKQADNNSIRQISQKEAISKIIAQTRHRFQDVENIDLMLQNVEYLVQSIPVFELHNKPEAAAVKMSYETMKCKAKEMNL